MRTSSWSVAVAMVAALVVGAPTARAGAFAHCDPAPTEADAVADADVVVVARAEARTRRVGREGLRTRFVVLEILKGAPPRRFVVTGCTHWKCGGGIWKRGERTLLLVRDAGRGRYAMVRGHCGNGFTRSALPDDPADPQVQAIRAAAAAPAAPAPAAPAPAPAAPAPD